MTEDIEDRISRAQVRMDTGRAIDVPGPVVFAQDQQPRGMVDLAIAEDDRADARVARAASGLQRREGFDLRAYIGRGVEQHPVNAIAADGDRGLRARTALEGAGPQPRAVITVAVPLRETAARPGAE